MELNERRLPFVELLIINENGAATPDLFSKEVYTYQYTSHTKNEHTVQYG